MKTIVLSLLFLLCISGIKAQSKTNDIPVEKLPAEVKTVLEEYLTILSTSTTIEDCAKAFVQIAGGALVNEDDKTITLRQDVDRFSLKKDYGNVKFYQLPLNITRVKVNYSNGNGFGASAIKGKVYKIWIAKKEGQPGLPAPVSILVPEGHPTIKLPKVVSIGSL